MADIFLSYVREDRARAEQLAAALGQLGWNVWWDRKILPGSVFRDAIAEELESAKCVVVLWSQKSVRSDYVRDEADDAKSRKVLVPVLIELVKPPHGFRQHEAANLIAWTGDLDDPEFGLLKSGILNYVSPSQAALSSVALGRDAKASSASVVDSFSRPAAAGQFEGDVHISYAHIDNQAIGKGESGWISSLHHALEIRLGQLLGRKPRIWRDDKLQGNDFFVDRIVDRLQSVAAFVPVLSPRYVRSEWCQRELDEFVKAAMATGGLQVGEKLRVFKVVKTPVPRELEPPALQSVLGYEFYTLEPHSGRHREFHPSSTDDKQYWVRLDDLAHDIAHLINLLEERPATPPA